MSRGFDFVVVGVIYIIAVVVHMMGVELFSPASPLHELASNATHFDSAAKADLWYEILSLWVPLIAAGGISAWAVVREYRRQATTAVVGRRAP